MDTITIGNLTLTYQQVFYAIAACAIVLLLVSVIKKMAKLAIICLTSALLLGYFGYSFPTNIPEAIVLVKDISADSLQKLADSSDNIKYEDGKLYYRESETSKWKSIKELSELPESVYSDFSFNKIGE